MKIQTAKITLRNQIILILAAVAILADVAPSGCGSSNDNNSPPVPVEESAPADEAEKPQE